MNIVFGIIIGLLILMALVVIHELGHFLLARKNGVKVNEFGIGFPPRAIAWVRNPKWQKGTKNGEKKWLRLPKSEWDKPQKTLIFSLNWLPIGGFCAMDGESDSDTRKGTFGAASFWGKTQILFGGVLMNWLAAFVILTVLAFVGMPQFINNQFYLGQDAEIIGSGVTVQEVMADSPAADAGLTTGDQITAVDGETIIYPDDITKYNSTHAGETVTYTITRVRPRCLYDLRSDLHSFHLVRPAGRPRHHHPAHWRNLPWTWYDRLESHLWRRQPVQPRRRHP